MLHAGMLLRHKRADMVSLASMADIAVKILTALAFAATVGPSGSINGNPLKLPACCVYAGVVTRMVICWGAYLKYVHADLPQLPPNEPGAAAAAASSSSSSSSSTKSKRNQKSSTTSSSGGYVEGTCVSMSYCVFYRLVSASSCSRSDPPQYCFGL